MSDNNKGRYYGLRYSTSSSMARMGYPTVMPVANFNLYFLLEEQLRLITLELTDFNFMIVMT